MMIKILEHDFNKLTIEHVRKGSFGENQINERVLRTGTS